MLINSIVHYTHYDIMYNEKCMYHSKNVIVNLFNCSVYSDNRIGLTKDPKT